MVKGFSSVLMRDDGGDPGGGGVLGVDGVPGVPLVSEPFLTRDLASNNRKFQIFKTVRPIIETV